MRRRRHWLTRGEKKARVRRGENLARVRRGEKEKKKRVGLDGQVEGEESKGKGMAEESR